MDFSFIPHYFEQTFKNVSVSTTDTSYVYFSKVNETSSFTLTMSKKFDLLEFEFKTDDQRFGQEFSFDNELKYKKASMENLCSLLIAIIQNLDKVGTWGTKSFNLNITKDRTKFIVGEFERLAAIYGDAKPHLRNYSLIEGQGKNIINFPPGLGLLIICEGGAVTFASGQDWKALLYSGSVGLFKLIGWWFHNSGETFEEWQKAPLRGFGLPEDPEPEVSQPPEVLKPAEPEVRKPLSHDQRFLDIYKRAREMCRIRNTFMYLLFNEYRQVHEQVIEASRDGSKKAKFPKSWISETVEQLLMEAGYEVSRTYYRATVSWSW